MTQETDETQSLFADKQAILKTLEKLNIEIGFIPVTGATAEHARELMAAQGIRAEDNSASREMIALRYPKEGK